MGTYFEAGVGKATAGTSAEMGRQAAAEALAQLNKFTPSLAVVFACSEFDIVEVNRGINDVLDGCPVIGTSTAGEIANGLVTHGVVVTLIASPHLKVRVGMGKGVSRDFSKAVDEALSEAGVTEYFNSEHPLHQMLHVSASGMPGVSPVLLLVFTPGATRVQPSLSHDIHTVLRKASANRIPIFGGSSADYLHFESNCQILNNAVSGDAIALAFLESEILFGLGMAHGFSPTTKGALITQASGHIVQELDGHPAAEVCADLLGVPLKQLGDGAVLFSRFPFGATDVYGNQILHVPERILDDGSIQFAPLMRNDQVITLMRGTAADMVEAGLSAYNKAVHHGGLKKPSAALMFSCALRRRLIGEDERKETEVVYQNAQIPLAGFYTFGEQGMSDDGLPIYSNQSVSMLVFSDELNPITGLIHKGKKIYYEFTSRLNRKVTQIKAIRKINQVIQDESEVGPLLAVLTREVTTLLPWADGAFYLPTDTSRVYTVANASDFEKFPAQLLSEEIGAPYIVIWLDSHGKRFGALVLTQNGDDIAPDEEDMVLAETIGKLTASGLHRIEVDGKLEMKLQQLEILNQLGYELSRTTTADSQLQNIVKHIRHTLQFSIASLWLVDRTHYLLVKETLDGDAEWQIGDVEKKNDELIAKWQIEHYQPLFASQSTNDTCPVKLISPFPYTFISLPVIYKGQLRGILNLYSKHHYKWSFQHDHITEHIEFLQTIATQVAVFLENRSLHKHTTFYKEMHHRVKNNLQNIASLLRLQIRRLDRVSAEQALTDSISRIMSIAVVHETLSQGEIGMVDLGRLVGGITKLSLTGEPEKPVITLDISGPSIMIPSREATSLALVINELVQNAVQHGFQEGDKGNLSIRVEQMDESVSLVVQNDGPGLPERFDPDQDSNLGLTIVRTLVKDELKGQFSLVKQRGTTATVTFPFPQGYYHIE